MPKKKYFVVWEGHRPGIYNSWNECQAQINGFPNAKFKGFIIYENAKKALAEGHEKYWGTDYFEITLTDQQIKKIGRPIEDSIVVDGGCSSSTGIAEYQGVYLKSRKQIFHKGPFEDGTNNIVEFLAIVHALAFCKKNQLSIPIYSDSKYAISWVRDKEARTNHSRSNRNKELFTLIDRAVLWLKENKYPNKILKWETKAWGENPADFGNK